MPNGKRIAGSPGTKPVAAGGEPTSPVAAPPTREPIGSYAPPSPQATHRRGEIAPDLALAIDAAAANREMLREKPHVIDVRAGYKFENGMITDQAAVVVVVDRKVDDLSNGDRIPLVVGGVPTDVAVADPIERLRESGGTEAAVIARAPRLLIDELQSAGAEAGVEAVPQITYQAPADGDLSPVTGPMSITCHVSPDAGWRVLKPFLEATEREIVLGMYDFTAPHIYTTARRLLKSDDVTWTQTLGPKESLPGDDDVDSTKSSDLTEAKLVRGLERAGGKRFKNAFAHVGKGQTFASAYHIKVAVRDGKAIWLSSGNMQSSNQPDVDFFAADADRSVMARFNREWHAVVESPSLAKRFRVFLQDDFEVATGPAPESAPLAGPDLLIPVEEFFAEEKAKLDLDVFAPKKFTFSSDNPLTVQPILTPDNYIDIVADLLSKRPKKSLYFQNQSLNPVLSPTPEFGELMQRLVDYSNDDELDVRIIFRNIGPVRKKLESLKATGFNMRRIRMQAGCHTKGIVIDSRTVLLGSHNFTNQGVQVNRDASLLIRNADIAKYYERIFLHDWERLAKPTINEESAVIPVAAGTEAAGLPEGEYVRVAWSYLDED